MAIFWGNSGSGKSDAAIQLAKYVIKFGTVLYLSWEQKDRGTIQTAFKRHGLLEQHGKIHLSPGGSFESVVAYLRKQRSPDFVFMDSIDFSKWTYAQYEELRLLFPKKSIVIVAHGLGSLPKKALAADIMFDADIKCRVNKYVGFVETTRFEGPQKELIVWEEKAREFHPYLFTDASSKMNNTAPKVGKVKKVAKNKKA